jgi:tetraacyldisaccharide 4'-kinase
MRFPGLLLFPFAVLYDAITSIRNSLYDKGIQPSASFDVPLISVGNLAVGGTGKTPMVEYLIRLLTPKVKVATLSRGYGRKSKGIRIATPDDSPSTLGDEPYLFYKKFGDKVVVAVGEERALAIPYILHEHPETGLIVLDDAFQHRRVKPSFQILLTQHNKLFVDDLLLPAGRLRESKRGASRADVVVVTKCPSHMSDDDMLAIERRLRPYADKPIFFATVGYGALMPVAEGSPYHPERIVLVTGIADPSPLESYLSAGHEVVKHIRYGDHHAYTDGDIRQICQVASKHSAAVVTTEKDLVKMDPKQFESASVGLYYLPIQIEFLKDGKEFDEMVRNVVISYAQ